MPQVDIDGLNSTLKADVIRGQGTTTTKLGGTLDADGNDITNASTVAFGSGVNAHIDVPNSCFVNIDSDNDETGARFAVAKDSTGTGGTELFRIQEDGKVGIGTTSPGDKLVVAGNTRIKSADGRLVGKNDDSAYSIGSSGGAAIRFIIDALNDEIAFETHKTAVRHAESMRISSSGYLGIGTTSPNEKLHVEGDGVFGASNSGSGSTLGVYGNLSVGSGGGGGYAATAAPSDGMIVAGIVGIGTTSPTTKDLHLEAGALSSGERQLYIFTTDTVSSTEYFINMSTSGGGMDNQFLVRTDGTANCDGSWSGGGADYAEYF